MKWLVQQGLYQDESYVEFIEILQRAGLDWESVQVIPFSDEFVGGEPQIIDNKVIAFGALTLHEIAQKRGWIPGVFSNSNFDYKALVDNLGEEVLNYDAEFTLFGRISIDKPMFIRPTFDSKSFAGNIFSPQAIKDWQSCVNGIYSHEYSTLEPVTSVLVAEPKQILAEYRFFIVDGKISTCSLYRRGGNPIFSKEAVGQDVINYVERILKMWMPHECFVIDIAHTETVESYNYNVFKVIEVNSLTGCGFYDIDISKLVQDLMILLKKYD